MLLIAHRGASAREPENSLAAFARALADGSDGIETDVRLTTDGRPVLMHDDDVSRTTEGTGRISSMTFDEVRALDPGDGRAVPSLEELFAMAAGRTRLYLELKGSFGPEGFRSAEPVARAVLPLVDGIDRVTLSSFDPTAVAAVREAAPLIRTALGSLPFVDPMQTLSLAIEAQHRELHVGADAVTRELVEAAHAARVRVLAFTVNDAARARELGSLGLDGVFTDDPGELRAALTR